MKTDMKTMEGGWLFNLKKGTDPILEINNSYNALKSTQPSCSLCKEKYYLEHKEFEK